MKKLIFMMLVLLVPIKGLAAAEQFMIWDDATGTLTFGYGDIDAAKSSNAHVAEGWSIDDELSFSPTAIEFYKSYVKKVVFKPECVNVKPTDLSCFFFWCPNLTEIDGIEYLNTSEATSMEYMFYGCEALTSLDLSSFNTSKVTSMSCMFYGCEALTYLDLSSFDTSNVTDMGAMFYECKALTSLDLSSFDTSNVTEMAYAVTATGTVHQGMFEGCSSLTSLDISNFNTSKVTSMNRLFYGCEALTSLDVSSFDTSNVRDMGDMFSLCKALTSLDVSNFDTSSVTNMESMFHYCSSLTSLDLSNFVPVYVPRAEAMFRRCTNLQTIYCNDTWTWDSEQSDNMFEDCTNIKGEDGTTYSSGNISSAYAHPNAGGYFTKKPVFSAVTIGSKTEYWTSFYTSMRNTMGGKDVTVYTVTLNNDFNTATLEEIADKIIPSEVPVLMKSTVENPTLFTPTSEGESDYSIRNWLWGTQTDITTSSVSDELNVFYTLACEGGVLGFYRYVGETLHGGKALLAWWEGEATSPARITIAGYGEETGIKSIGAETVGTDGQQGQYYDLQGRRVSPTRKGIYVINGKKVVK